MKKLVLFLLAVLLLFTASVALADKTMTASDMSGKDGQYIQFPDYGIEMWIPADMKAVKQTKDVQYEFSNGKKGWKISLEICSNTNCKTREAIVKRLKKEYKAKNPQLGTVNGEECVFLEQKNKKDTRYFVYMHENGETWYLVSAYGMTKDAQKKLAMQVLSSIRKIPDEEYLTAVGTADGYTQYNIGVMGLSITCPENAEFSYRLGWAFSDATLNYEMTTETYRVSITPTTLSGDAAKVADTLVKGANSFVTIAAEPVDDLNGLPCVKVHTAFTWDDQTVEYDGL